MATQAHPVLKRIVWGALLALAVLALLLGAVLAALDTSYGRGWVKNQIEALEFDNGLRIGVGAIDGSLYSAMRLRDLTLSDPKGVFARAPDIDVSWNPFAFLVGHVDIKRVAIETATLSRVPEFIETAPSDDPILPDYTIDIGDAAIERLIVEAPVAGSERIATLSAKVQIEDQRANVSLYGSSVASGPDASAGDKLIMVLAAVPEDNRLDLELELSAPGDGVIAAMAGWSGPLNARLEGEGTWSQWNGQFTSEWMEQPLAALDLTARAGVFKVNGPAQLSPLLPASIAPLFAGETLIDAEAKLDEETTLIDARLSTNALSTAVQGALDLEQSRFEKLQLQVSIDGTFSPAADAIVSGIAAEITLDGGFAEPSVIYDVTAQRLSFAGVGLEGLSTAGQTRFDLQEMEAPINAQAMRVTGLDQAAGGPLSDVRLTGDLLVSWPRLVSDNLRLRSSRLDTALTFVADADKGRYGGAIDGTLGDYRIESVGLFAVEAGADVDFDVDAGAAVAGAVKARSTQLSNESVAGFLGGDMSASSDFAYGRDGVTRLANIRLVSPLVQVEAGEGTYSANGELDITASGVSQDYGPFGLQLAGTLTDPFATIDAPSPGLGVGLANVTAKLRGEGGVYRIDARGETDFGPVSATVNADYSSDPAVLDIEASDWGGIGFTGRLTQSEAGILDGQLRASGNGVEGRVDLFGSDEVQFARAKARARNVVFPGAARARIGRAIMEADVGFYDQPQIAADVQITKARYFDTAIDTLRAEITVANGQGSAKVLASGQSTAPFTLAANADLQADLWRTAISGKVKGIEFRSDSPARIIPPFASGSETGDYELLPTRFVFNRGRLRLSGRFGDGIEVKTRLDALNLALLNRFVPGLGLSGKATGSLDFAQTNADLVPRVDAEIKVKGFSRSTALTVSEPVDVTFAGRMREDAATGRAVIRQGGDVIGRVHTDLTPFAGASGAWMDRFLEARLGGGLRYTGPVANIFSLAGLADQSLTGPVGVAADFSGTLVEPSFDGTVRARGLTYENATFGTRVSGLDARGRFDGDELVIERAEADAGRGRLTASGTIGLSSGQGFPMKLAVSLDNAQLARSDALGARATGDLTITKRAGERALLAGTLVLPETRYKLSYVDTSEVPELAGVRFVGGEADLALAAKTANRPVEPGFEDVRLDLKLIADDEVYVSGLGLQSEWSANLRVTGTSFDPRLRGEIDLVRGTLDFAGRTFDLQRGRIRFNGEASLEPQIALSATEAIRDVTVSVDVDGRAFSPQIEFTSTPGLPQDEILARILFGSSIANLSALEAVQLARSLNTLSGSGGGLNPVGALRSATGVDRLRILAPNGATGQETAIAAGQYISDDIYVEVITDARGFTATQLEISLSRTLSVLSQASGAGGTNISVRYRKDY
ncbi:MAG: translocation/assembly module TamB domain-containing protein [Pseudomonadota bacterium]